ncbi:rod shape-determining protein MreD [Paenibacillus gansuensis]|uniref:Rod shape-determining protein MreD n=1 Tax=Paenibacillus gansuensis TaxID=306542 RepID=A0ABW5PBI5_9BACL
MRRNLILILLALFVLEGSVLPWLIPGSWQEQVRLAPHLVFVFIIYIALYINRYYALTFGLMFGALHDMIYYGHMLGNYTFSMAVVAYLAGLLLGRGASGLAQTLFAVLVFNFLLDSLIFGIYTLFSKVNVEYTWAVLHQIIPSLFLNVLFALIIYIPARRFLEGTLRPPREEEQD